MRQIFGLKNLRILLAWGKQNYAIHLRHFMVIPSRNTYKINGWLMRNICYFILIFPLVKLEKLLGVIMPDAFLGYIKRLPD